MATIYPWSLKGVSVEARKAARTAAAAHGMTVGAWLAEVIRTTAAEEQAAAAGAAAAIADLSQAAGPAADTGEDTTELMAQIALLEAKLAAAEASLAAKRARPAPTAGEPAPSRRSAGNG
ncbi:MAG: hypothetical protein AB7K86_19805 [Rhodospirillales bacterium]